MTGAVHVTTFSVLYRQEPDALARVLSVLRRLRVRIEALSAMPAERGTSRALIVIRCPAYHATRARALIARLVPVIEVVELGAAGTEAPDGGPFGEAEVSVDEEGDDGNDAV